jgi:hypothetical protein
VQSEEIPVAGSTMIHDFAITDSSVIFMDLPVVFDLESALTGKGFPYKWDDDYGARLGIMPRGGSAAEITWVEIDPCYIFHPMNAYERAGSIVLDVAERPPGLERSLFERARQWGARQLMDWAFDTKIDPTAHAMLIALPKGSELEVLWPDGPILVDDVKMPLHQAIYRQRFTGTHDPTAIFIAAGGAIKKQSERGRLSVLDVAPFVAYLAGSALPNDLEGNLPIDWITREAAAKNPPRVVQVSHLPLLSAMTGESGVGTDESGSKDPALIEKLRALGYIE